MEDITGIVIQNILPEGTIPLVGDICKSKLGYFKWTKEHENSIEFIFKLHEYNKLQVIEFTIAVKFSDLPMKFQELSVNYVYNVFDDKLIKTDNFVKHSELQARLVYSTRDENYLNCETLLDSYLDIFIEMLNNKQQVNVIHFCYDYFLQYYNNVPETISMRLHDDIRTQIISKIYKSVELTLNNILETSLIDPVDSALTLEYQKETWLNKWISKNI